jgi:hypothetical protein
MGLKESFDAAMKNRPGPLCRTGAVIKNLSKDESQLVEDWLKDPEILASQIHKALTDEGYKVGYDSIRRHRRGLCDCRSL